MTARELLVSLQNLSEEDKELEIFCSEHAPKGVEVHEDICCYENCLKGQDRMDHAWVLIS